MHALKRVTMLARRIGASDAWRREGAFLMRRVAMIGTGGSISTVGRHNLDLYEYGDFGRVVDAAELLGMFPEVSAHADVTPFSFQASPSSALGPPDWLALNERIHEICVQSPDLDGVVVSHGTATLEETAYFLNLSLKVSVPVVLVGAQRPPNALSTDAGLNLVNAVRVAASPNARGIGVLVVINDEINAARDVTKSSNYRLQAFRSPDVGLLGFADPDEVVLYRSPNRRHAPDTVFDVRGLKSLPRVDIAYSYAGSDGSAIRAFVRAGAEGVVIAGLAPGKATPEEYQAVRDAQMRGIVIVQSSRAGSGRVLPREVLRASGTVSADNLNPQKARVLAMLALLITKKPSDVQDMFMTY